MNTALHQCEYEHLCTSVNTNMTLQFSVYLKQLPTVRTVIWSSVAVYITFMCLQVAGLAETSVTQWTFVQFVSRRLLMCVVRVWDWLNALSHMWHLYGLSPVWILMCVVKCPDWINALTHTYEQIQSRNFRLGIHVKKCLVFTSSLCHWPLEICIPR